MEEPKEDVQIAVKPKYSMKKLFRNTVLIILATALGYTHYKYVLTLHEENTNFSHLSELEREMLFETEMGFYYSYFKIISAERPLVSGVRQLMRDRLVEYPNEINALNRFNIHPEVLIGAMYLYLEPYINNTSHRNCHVVHRGEVLKPVESCVGLGHPIFFYLEAVWVLAGLFVSAIFLHAVTLSESILGGLLAVVQYFANHAECTRVMWTPNERENMAAPFLFLQTWCLTLQLRKQNTRTAFHLQVAIFLLNGLCLLFWQFSQFIFLTQTAIFFVMEQLKIIDLKVLCIFLHSHFCGLHLAVLLLQGNDMLKSSLYTSFFLVVSAYCLFFSSLRIKIKNRFDLFFEGLLILQRTVIIICVSLYLKKLMNNFWEVEEDTHIWEILYSKLSNYKSFHTLIYTCAAVFDRLPLSSIVNMTRTLLIPFVILSIVNVIKYWTQNALNKTRKYPSKFKKPVIEKSEENSDDSGIENNTDSKKRDTDLNDLDGAFKDELLNDIIEDHWICFLSNLRVDPAIFYNISQMVVFGVMAGLVMRLKLLFSTQMCIVSSLILGPKYDSHPNSKVVKLAFWVLSLTVIYHRLSDNIATEMSFVGEYSDPPKEELMEWISTSTNPKAVFAGSMHILATVMLTSRRAILAHPHYEHKEARDRAYTLYKVYGKFSSEEYYQELTKLKATHLIVEHRLCYGKSEKGCTFQEIWDIEAPSYASNPVLCNTLLTQPTEHFYKVFENEQYSVFWVHDLSVRYMPRSFDT